MRVFLTGGTGFIGSHVLRELLSAGCEVAALVREGNPMWRLQDIKGKFTVINGSLYEMETWRSLLREWQPEACIHLAWYAEPGKYLHSPENIPALKASIELLEQLIEVGCQQVVMAGTCAEYDTDLGFLREDGATDPKTIYAATKLSMNLIGQQMAAAAGIRFAWGRIFYLYGPMEDERRLVPALIRSLRDRQPFKATLGEQVRDYSHVEDIASAFVTLAEKQANGVFNIASGVPVTMGQLMETLGNIVGCPELIKFGALPYRDWEPPFICGDNQRLRSVGWSPRYSLQNGLFHTLNINLIGSAR